MRQVNSTSREQILGSNSSMAFSHQVISSDAVFYYYYLVARLFLSRNRPHNTIQFHFFNWVYVFLCRFLMQSKCNKEGPAGRAHMSQLTKTWVQVSGSYLQWECFTSGEAIMQVSHFLPLHLSLSLFNKWYRILFLKKYNKESVKTYPLLKDHSGYS